MIIRQSVFDAIQNHHDKNVVNVTIDILIRGGHQCVTEPPVHTCGGLGWGAGLWSSSITTNAFEYNHTLTIVSRFEHTFLLKA